jgi:collagen type IV alpha
MRSDIDFVSRHGGRVRSSLAVAGAGTLLVLSPHSAQAAGSAAHVASSTPCAAAPACAAGSPASATGALGLLAVGAPRTLSVGTPVGVFSLQIGLDPLSSCGCGLSLKAHLAPAGSRSHSNPSSLNGSLPGRAPAVPVPSGGAVSSCGCPGHGGTGAATAVAVQVDVTVGVGTGAGTPACGCPGSATPTPKPHHRPKNPGSPGGGTTTPPGGGTTAPPGPGGTTTGGGVGAGPAPAAPTTTPSRAEVEPAPAAGTGLAETGSPVLPGLAGLLILGVGGFLEWRRRAAR